MANKLEGRARELLEQPNFVAVATVDEDGVPDVKVVWADVDGDKVVLNSAEGRKWPERLRNQGRATVTVVNHDNPYEYAVIKGRLTDDTHDGADENIDALAKKYLGKDEYPFRQPGEQRVLFRLEPERVKLHGG
jgi:PPOX class probable F420-dependent enzyme